MAHRRGSDIRRQRGAALWVLSLLLLSGALLLLERRLATARLAEPQSRLTQEALERARRALVAHAMTYHDRRPGRFGVLPCPDVHGLGFLPEGVAHGSCGARGAAALGRLPWRSLGIEPLRDGAGECLWYAVAGDFKPNPAARMLNADSAGTFRVRLAGVPPIPLTGESPLERAAALIVAPGPTLAGQQRGATTGSEVCGGNYQPNNYLDGSSSGVPGEWIATGFAGAWGINDRIAVVTAAEVFEAVRRRADFAARLYDPIQPDNLTRKAAECLAAYGRSHAAPGNFSLPWPAPVALGDPADEAFYDDRSPSGNALFGRLPDRVDDSNGALGESGITRVIAGCAEFASGSEARTLWRNWKDHLFYAVGDAYQPTPMPTPSCNGGARCISINHAYPGNAGRSYAAVVWFAGARFSGQDRDTPGERARPESYLEEGNRHVYRDTPGDDATMYVSQPVSDLFNDVAYCLLPAVAHPANPLEVVPCPHD